jgi:cytochrome c-type biogenesis protein CcmF
VNPLVGFIWFGCFILILGSFVCMFPEFQLGESRAWRVARTVAAVAGIVTMSMILALMPTQAFALQTSSMHSGTVKIENEAERDVFQALRCMCGTCARDPLSTCACGTADAAREQIRGQMRAGRTKAQIIEAYEAALGTEALSTPPNRGVFRSVYILPFGALAGGLGIVFLIARGWQRGGTAAVKAEGTPAAAGDADGYDSRLDQELKDLDG